MLPNILICSNSYEFNIILKYQYTREYVCKLFTAGDYSTNF